MEGSAGVAIVFFLTGEVPQDHGLVPRRGQEDVGVIQRGREWVEVTQFSCLRGKVNNRTSVTSSVRAYRTEDGDDDEKGR